MRSFAQRQNQAQGQMNSSLARSRTASPGKHRREDLIDPASTGTASRSSGHDFGRISIGPPAAGAMTITSPQTNIGHQLPSRGLTHYSGEHFAAGASLIQNLLVQGRIPPPGDTIHGPLLDQYARDTGLARDTVAQHDPGYEAWLLGRPIAPPSINITLDMPVPATPAPDYSRDETQLGAWERANFLISPQSWFSCDHVVNNGIESSFVTDVGIRFTQATFEYFIARHIFENMSDPGRPAGERVTWSSIHIRVRQHAGVHFTRYRQVVDSMRQTIMQRFASLPTRSNPIRIPQRDLEAYLGALLVYLVARLHFELWQTTCSWEHADYPNLLRGIPDVRGTFVPACDPRPTVPPEPITPVVVTPGQPRPRSPARQTRPSP